MKIERTKNANYDKNQAFKDLWLIVNIILEKEKKLKAFEIINKKEVNIAVLKICFTLKEYNRYILNNYLNKEIVEELSLTQEEFDLLKEELL